MIEMLETRLLLAAGPRQMEFLDRGVVATRGQRRQRDLGLLAGVWQQPSGKDWFDGDFTYDGAVDIGDLGLLAGKTGKRALAIPSEP